MFSLLSQRIMKKTKTNIKKPKLTLNLIPKSSWFKSVRSHITQTQWNKIRKEVYRKANYTCQICGINEENFLGCKKGWLHANELWKFKDGVQSLVGLEAICRTCHLVKHFGYAEISGRRNQALNHLMKVNKWDVGTTNEYLKQQFEEWEERSEIKWIIDYSFINGFCKIVV